MVMSPRIEDAVKAPVKQGAGMSGHERKYEYGV